MSAPSQLRLAGGRATGVADPERFDGGGQPLPARRDQQPGAEPADERQRRSRRRRTRGVGAAPPSSARAGAPVGAPLRL